MSRVLILFAHPALEKSRIHVRLLRHIPQHPSITFRDLYELYPDFDIDVKAEQELLLTHDIIIWQHPFYWYSAPALIKQWQDLVLEHGWAYGTGGTKLAGKKILSILTCGGTEDVYQHNGRNRFNIREFLLPFDQTAYLCGMQYLPPFVIYGTHRLKEAQMNLYAIQYKKLLIALTTDEFTDEQWKSIMYFNDLLPVSQLSQP